MNVIEAKIKWTPRRRKEVSKFMGVGASRTVCVDGESGGRSRSVEGKRSRVRKLQAEIIQKKKLRLRPFGFWGAGQAFVAAVDSVPPPFFFYAAGGRSLEKVAN